MENLIRVLPDFVANQIAAGEVIQRPASVVKELMENAIDAGSTQIDVVLKDAGRSMIMVIDNGKGMSPADAHIAFERHATSKLRQASDLFQLHTMGFRGEALASIASVAQVDLVTRRPEDELAWKVEIEGSVLINEEPTLAAQGSRFTVRNLFFNI
ncbi:MAG TPA: DNA mismatch repair endonuclease MutL, partial [Bacteroidales bacterium]